jgi:hypothetical protein
MSKRSLLILAGAGLILFVLAVMLSVRSLPHFVAGTPDDSVTPITGSILAYDSDKLAAGGLFVFRPGSDTPSDWPGRLARHDITVGSPTGDGGYIVRVPAGTRLSPGQLPGAALEPYQAIERLCPELRTTFTTPLEDTAQASSATAASKVTMTISLFDAGDKPGVDMLVRQLGGNVLRGMDEEGTALRVRLPSDRVTELAAAPEVIFLESYTPPDMLNDRARDVVSATPVTVPGFITPAGLGGAGQIVALADSGIDKGSLSDIHPDLMSTPGKMPKIVFINPFSGGNPADTIGHGTHMAATIAGTGIASGGKYKGVAPEASLFVQSILNRQGKIDPPADLVSLFRPAYEAGARVHVNGWGGKTNAYLSSPSQVDRFVQYYPDFLAVFGAGNSGPGAATLTPEANSKNALVVGASQNPRPNYGLESQNAGSLAAFSSRGPAGDGRIKPDLVVPGSAIISAKSSLIEGNFTANPAYTRLQGTSMSAAIAGGASALVREYLQNNQGIRKPSAALVKAILINGARPLDGQPYDSGFGLMDLTGTLLALNEETFAYGQDDAVGTGDSLTYTFKVTQTGTPFKATLTWTDPAASPGAARALVNDLDLRVVDPDGREYLGNDFQARGVTDSANNVEQVVVDDPVPGTYKVIVRGATVGASVRPDTNRPVQDFAVVYGQPLARDTAIGGDSSNLTLAGGGSINLSAKPVQGVVNERRGLPSSLTGADVYTLGSGAGLQKAFLVSRYWQADAVKCIPITKDDLLLVQINQHFREGGYYLAPGHFSLLNGIPIPNQISLPVGASAQGFVSPSKQLLYHLEATYHEEQGILASINHLTGSFRLLGDSREYTLAREAAIAFVRNVVGGDRKDLPFGATIEADTQYLFPGVQVRLIQPPGRNQVNYLVARNQVVVGSLRGVSDKGDSLTISDGQRFPVLPGIIVQRDGRMTNISSLVPGDLVFATVIPGEKNIIGITAYSSTLYGQVVFAGAQNLYLSDYWGNLHTLRLTDKTKVFRWDIVGDASLLAPGLMVRVNLAPGTRDVWRVDIAESAAVENGTIASYDPQESVLRTTDGRSYPVAANTTFTKNGLPVHPRDLVSGEAVSLSVLSSTSGATVLAGANASTKPGVAEPTLHIEAVIPLSDRYIVSGKTSADTLYAWRGRPSFSRLQLTADGSFYWSLPYASGTGKAQLVAVDTRTGGISGRQVTLSATAETTLSDVQGSWARRDIENLLARGLISGYPDGTFRPGHPVTRTEFTVLLARLLGLPEERNPELPFRDAEAIPDWARETVGLAYLRGIASGYEDGTFRPNARISRVEGAAILMRSCAALGVEVPDDTAPVFYSDWTEVPDWGRQVVAQANAVGLMGGRPDNRFAPGAYLSRAETASILNRLLEKLES